MLSVSEFEKLLERPESSILDFKQSMYDFADDVELKTTSKFVKDVICFSNTIRKDSSYILIGVEEKSDGEKVLHGLNQDIDDSILQQKVLNKVQPRPRFYYYTIIYSEKKFGVLEFPVTKYNSPIFPIVKLKGLEVGKVYYRQNTANTEALGMETININSWFQSLPEIEHTNTINDEINILIKKLTQSDEKLSITLADIYAFSQRSNLEKLKTFCSFELQGFDGEDVDKDPDEFKYRIQKVFVSLDTIEINPYYNLSTSYIKKQFEEHNGFHHYRLLFNQAIVNIEELIQKFKSKPDSVLAVITMSSKQVLNTESDAPLYAYVFEETYTNLYGNIRQKAIDKLMQVNQG